MQMEINSKENQSDLKKFVRSLCRLFSIFLLQLESNYNL